MTGTENMMKTHTRVFQEATTKSWIAVKSIFSRLRPQRQDDHQAMKMKGIVVDAGGRGPGSSEALTTHSSLMPTHVNQQMELSTAK